MSRYCEKCGGSYLRMVVLGPGHARKECVGCGSTGPFTPTAPHECGFCKGQPVGDAASWLDGKPRPPLPCPRCGKTAASPVSVTADQEANDE